MALMKLKRSVIDRGEPIKREIPFPLSNGIRNYDVFGHPLYDEEGELLGAATASTDIGIID